MLESLKYKNYLGEIIDFGKDGIFVNASDLHDYAWTVTSKGKRIAALTREISTRNLPVIIICASEAQGIAARNKLMEVCEKDCLAMQPGQIILGNYYFACYVTQSQKKDYLISKRYLPVTLGLTSDRPYWVKESTVSIGAAASSTNEGLDYGFDYPIDYTPDVISNQIVNPAFADANFKLVIYGAVTNPAITIGGHVYQVNCAVAAGEYLTIDSLTKKIFLTGSGGAVTNKFNDRNRDSYIFEKIPAGANAVAWSGSFGFDVTIYEERSEPKWT